MPDDVAAAAPAAYSEHLASIGHALPAKVMELATTLSLHDALLRSISYNPDLATLEVRFRIGDNQAGYANLDLAYKGAEVDPGSLASLFAALSPAGVELLYDEFDIVHDRCTHSFLFWPTGEASVGFKELEWSTESRTSRTA
jgi:hypothetical protein